MEHKNKLYKFGSYTWCYKHHSIAQYVMVLHGISCYFMVLHGIAWYSIYCTVFHICCFLFVKLRFNDLMKGETVSNANKYKHTV